MLVFGDSLIEQASPYFRSTDQVRAYGGTALCDWVDKMARAAAVEQPSVMVVEFVGNDVTPCMQGYQTPDQVRAKYEADMARLKRRVDAPILWVGAPAFRDQAPATLGLYSSEPKFVDPIPPPTILPNNLLPGDYAGLNSNTAPSTAAVLAAAAFEPPIRAAILGSELLPPSSP